MFLALRFKKEGLTKKSPSVTDRLKFYNLNCSSNEYGLSWQNWSFIIGCVCACASIDGCMNYLTYIRRCVRACNCVCVSVRMFIFPYINISDKKLCSSELCEPFKRCTLCTNKHAYICIYVCVSVCKFIVSCLLGFLWTKSTTKHVPTCPYVMIYVCMYILTYVYACLQGNCNNFPLDGKNKKERTKKQE